MFSCFRVPFWSFLAFFAIGARTHGDANSGIKRKVFQLCVGKFITSAPEARPRADRGKQENIYSRTVAARGLRQIGATHESASLKTHYDFLIVI